MLNPGTYLQDRYEILEKIGSGGMSVVYKARCHTLNRLVAIKVLKEEFASDENFVSKFKMEAQAAARLSHPNIVNVYDVVDEESLHYIVMELIEGITLKSYIEKKGFLESKEAIGIAIQVAQGIAAAHEHHIIHRDIKPQNMIISRDGKVKVADFGIARAVSSQTIGSNAVGSVHYISPEQARGGYCDERSDIYSFGITLYEMVTGKVPFEGDNTVSVALAHLEDPVVPPGEYHAEIYPGLEDIILRCTRKKPDRRYPSMEEVIRDLRRVLMDPDCDIYSTEEAKEEADLSQTRPITRGELSQINDLHRRRDRNGREEEETEEKTEPAREETELAEDEDGEFPVQEVFSEEMPGKAAKERKRPSHKKGPQRKNAGRKSEDDMSTQFERIITVIGIVAAILVVVVVVFVFSRLTGLFWPGSGQTQPQTETAAEASSTEEIQISLSDTQTEMPDVLNLPQDMTESKLKEYSLVMKVTGEEYSDNYEAGRVMRQDVDAGSTVEKWSTVGVTISKGSDRVDVKSLGLSNMDQKKAETLLKEKGLSVSIKEAASDTVAKGKVISWSTDEAKAGDTIELTVSTGPAAVQGQVPTLVGTDASEADSLLKAAGLVTGTVTYDSDPSKPQGQVLTQSELPGTMLEPQSSVDYVVNDSSQASQQAAETQAKTGDEGKYYVGSIDATCSLSNYIGPASQTSSVRILIRLKQKDPNDANTYVYTNLISPRLVVGSQDVPVVFSRIKGAYGVDSGTVEVVDADNDKVIQSWPVSFFPAG